MIRLALFLTCLGTTALSAPICVCLKCIAGPYDVFWAPAGSMKPAILPGQCFTTRTSFDRADLTPGTIITFRHPISGEDWFKRIVATEGQTAQMSSGRLLIDGQPVAVEPAPDFIEPFTAQGPAGSMPRCANTPSPDGGECVKSQWFETLGGQTYSILDLGKHRYDDTGPFTVPAGHLFVLGDHRDNSVDSRIPIEHQGIGFVPLENVTGIFDEVRP